MAAPAPLGLDDLQRLQHQRQADGERRVANLALDADLAAVRKSDAEAAAVLIQNSVLDPLEERQRLASDPNSGYTSIDVNKVPEPMEDPDAKPDDGVSDDDAK